MAARSVRCSAVFTSTRTSMCLPAVPTAPRKVTRTAPVLKSRNTGNRLTAGIAKLTVRPADGHEVKLGTIFQEDLFSVGQPPRRAGDPNSANANGTNNLSGTSIYRSDVKNYTTTLGWKYSTAGRQMVRLGREGLLESHRERPDQDGPYQRDCLPPSAAACRAMRSPAVSAATAATSSIRSASTSTTRRASIPAIGAMRSPTGWMPSRTRWRPMTCAGPPTSRRRAASARCPAGSCSGRPTTPHCWR